MLSNEVFTISMSHFCDKIVTIKKIIGAGYYIVEHPNIWTDEMFEPKDYLQIGTKFKKDNEWFIVGKDCEGKLFGFSNVGKHIDLSKYNTELTTPYCITEIRAYKYADNPQDSDSGRLIWQQPRFKAGDIIVMWNQEYRNYNIALMRDSQTVSCVVNTDGVLENVLDQQLFALSRFEITNSRREKYMFYDAVMRSGGYIDFDFKWKPFECGDKVKVYANAAWTSAIITKIVDGKIYTDDSYYPATYVIRA